MKISNNKENYKDTSTRINGFVYYPSRVYINSDSD